MADPVRYVALGDSYTIGTAVHAAESFPSRLVAAVDGLALDRQEPVLDTERHGPLGSEPALDPGAEHERRAALETIVYDDRFEAEDARWSEKPDGTVVVEENDGSIFRVVQATPAQLIVSRG